MLFSSFRFAFKAPNTRSAFLTKTDRFVKIVIYVFLLHFNHIDEKYFQKYQRLSWSDRRKTMWHNYVYYVHLQCFEPLFCQIGKDSLPSEISSEYMVMFEKAPRGYFPYLLLRHNDLKRLRDMFGGELYLLLSLRKSRFLFCVLPIGNRRATTLRALTAARSETGRSYAAPHFAAFLLKRSHDCAACSRFSPRETLTASCLAAFAEKRSNDCAYILSAFAEESHHYSVLLYFLPCALRSVKKVRFLSFCRIGE